MNFYIHWSALSLKLKKKSQTLLTQFNHSCIYKPLICRLQEVPMRYAWAYIKAQSAHSPSSPVRGNSGVSVRGAHWCWLTALTVGAQSSLYACEGSTLWLRELCVWIHVCLCPSRGSGAPPPQGPAAVRWALLNNTKEIQNTFPCADTGTPAARKEVKIGLPQDYLMHAKYVDGDLWNVSLSFPSVCLCDTKFYAKFLL